MKDNTMKPLDADVAGFINELKKIIGEGENEQKKVIHPLTQDKNETTMLAKKRKILYRDGHYAFAIQTIVDRLPAGQYQPAETRDDVFLLSDINALKVSSDEPKTIIDFGKESENETQIPITPFADYFPMENYCPPLKKLRDNLDHFLDKKEFYQNHRIDFKRSFFLYGEPGTGKSRFIDAATQELVKNQDAIVIRIESRQQLNLVVDKGILHFNDYLKDRLIVFVIEEVYNLIGASREPAELLNFLDSSHLRNNVIFFLSTNYPEQLPENLIDRPSRIDMMAGLYATDYSDGIIEAWYTFLTGKQLPTEVTQQEWYMDATKKLTPAYLKELFLYTELESVSMEEAWNEISKRKKLIKDGFPKRKKEQGVGFT